MQQPFTIPEDQPKHPFWDKVLVEFPDWMNWEPLTVETIPWLLLWVGVFGFLFWLYKRGAFTNPQFVSTPSPKSQE